MRAALYRNGCGYLFDFVQSSSQVRNGTQSLRIELQQASLSHEEIDAPTAAP